MRATFDLVESLFNNSKADWKYGGGWYLISHKSGVRCEELRGGGSPPCL